MSVQPTDLFPYNESRAIRKKLEGITVTASNYPGGRAVPVGYVNPDFELRNAAYPGIYLSYGMVSRATDREHRGDTALTYAPPGKSTEVLVPADMEDKNSSAMVPWSDTGFDRLSSPYRVQDTPVPFNVDYNVAVLTRNYQQAFEIQAQLQDIERLPERFGFLNVPEDGTVRTLELLGGPETSVIEDEDNKRLVQVLYSVRVAAELDLYSVDEVQRVADVDITYYQINQSTQL